MALTEAMKKYHRDWYHAHKDVHGPRKNARAAKRYRLLRHVTDAIKLISGCKNCGYCKHPRALEFHHRDPATKLFDVASAVTGIGFGKFLEEISKCDVLCANCHAEHHDSSFVESSDSGSLRPSEG